VDVLRWRLRNLGVEDVRLRTAITTGVLVAGGKGDIAVLVGRGEGKLVVNLRGNDDMTQSLGGGDRGVGNGIDEVDTGCVQRAMVKARRLNVDDRHA
jgi:hypothetical protein